MGYEIVSSLRVGGKLIAFQLVLTFVLVIVANLIVYRLTRTTEPDELTRWALMVLAVWVAQAIILKELADGNVEDPDVVILRDMQENINYHTLYRLEKLEMELL